MEIVFLLLLLAAALCFLLAACGVNSRVGLVPLGLFFWVLVALIKAFEAANL